MDALARDALAQLSARAANVLGGARRIPQPAGRRLAARRQSCPTSPPLLWKYALAQSPEEFAAVAAPVLAMFTVSECGNWLSNETLMQECVDRDTYARRAEPQTVRGRTQRQPCALGFGGRRIAK